MIKPVQTIIVLLLIFGCTAYLYGVVRAILGSLRKNGNPSVIPEFLNTMVQAIGGVLATNTGAVLGITISNSASEFSDVNYWNPATLFADPNITSFQICACYVYLISLVAAFVVWAIRDFDKSRVEQIIEQLSKSLLGVIVGVVTVALIKPGA